MAWHYGQFRPDDDRPGPIGEGFRDPVRSGLRSWTGWCWPHRPAQIPQLETGICVFRGMHFWPPCRTPIVPFWDYSILLGMGGPRQWTASVSSPLPQFVGL